MTALRIFVLPPYPAGANRAAFGVEDPLPTLLVSNIFIKYDADGKEIAYTFTDADIDPEDLSTNAFASGQYAEAGAVNYAVTEVNGYKVGLFGLEGENSYGYCKNSDLTRMDCPTVSDAFTFESTQNLVGFMPTLTATLGYGAIPFAPYDEATGTYAAVPADNTSDAYYVLHRRGRPGGH